MKFKGHESFAIRRGWLYKGMKYVQQRKDIFLAKDAMEKLGLGNNMVKSLRYWMQATGLTEESNHGGRRVQALTPLGRLIWQEDPYVEERGTLWLLHAALATNQNLATSWQFFFHDFSLQEFTRNDFVKALQGEVTVAESSLASDYDCILATYVSRGLLKGKVDPESNIECPLSRLGLIGIATAQGRDKVYRRECLQPEAVPLEIFMAVLLRMADGRKELRLQDIMSGTAALASLGKLFGLDFAGVLTLLYQLEGLAALKVVRTAGLDVVRIRTDMVPLGWAKKYYEGLVR